ncbi:conjugal transfer protein, partial|nr:conjugal transfer protein [Escherichia coli]
MKKREYPKTVFRKKLIKSVFWLGFGLVFFLSIIAVVRVGNATVAKVEEPVV